MYKYIYIYIHRHVHKYITIYIIYIWYPQPLATHPASPQDGVTDAAHALSTWGGRTEHQAQLAQFDGLTLHVPPGAMALWRNGGVSYTMGKIWKMRF